MAKFPIERAPEKVEVRPTAVRAGLDVRKGGRELAVAISGFGGALADLGIRYDITQAQTQLSEFQRKANEEINRLALSFDTNLDPETYRAEYKKSAGTIRSLIPKNRRAARAAELWLNAKEPAWSVGVDKARLNRADDNWLAELFAKQTAVSQTGQVGTFPAFIAEGVKAGRIDKSDAIRILAQTRLEANRRQLWNNATGAIRPDGEIDWSEAIKWFSKAENIKGIDPKVIDSLLEDAGTQFRWQQRRDAEKLEPDPITNMMAWDELDGLVTEYQINPVNEESLLERLAEERFDNRTLSDADYKAFKKRIATELLKEDSYWLRESRNHIEEFIRERDRLSGMLRTERGLMAKAKEALITLDAALEAARKEGKPLKGRDILIKAHEIAALPAFRAETKKEQEEIVPTIGGGISDIVLLTKEPQTLTDFYEIVGTIKDEDEARAYYEKWLNKFEKAKKK